MMALAVGLLLLGVGLALAAGWLWRRTRLPVGLALDSDAGARPGRLLRSGRHGLEGRPDYLIRQGRSVIPVEVKPSHRRVYRSAALQLTAYCLLVEEHYGRPPHGILLLRDHAEIVPYTDEMRAELLATLEVMRAAPLVPPRDHRQPARCRACSLAPLCSEALEA